jgi:hypothetical protein
MEDFFFWKTKSFSQNRRPRDLGTSSTAGGWLFNISEPRELGTSSTAGGWLFNISEPRTYPEETDSFRKSGRCSADAFWHTLLLLV